MSKRTSPLARGISWLLTAAGLMLPALAVNVAEASCGDYLAIDAVWQTSHDDAAGLMHRIPLDGEAPAPCDGPSCRSIPHAPLPSSPIRPVSSEIDHWCAELAQAGAEPSATKRLCFNDWFDIPSGSKLRIDRPPRV